MHKLEPGVPADLIPDVEVVEVRHLADADAKTDAVPFPAAEALLDDPPDLPDQVLVLRGRGGGGGGDGEHDDDAAQHLKDLLGLGGEERGGPLGGGGDEVQPYGHCGRVVGRPQAEVVGCARERRRW